MFRRGGKLRFALENVQLPPAVAAFTSQPIDRPSPVQAQLVAAEGNPSALKVDQEGTAKATESKTRLLRPVIAALVAAKSNDNDAGRQSISGSGTGNASGRALGGLLGIRTAGNDCVAGTPSDWDRARLLWAGMVGLLECYFAGQRGCVGKE